jgi:methyl-accepting chemotaxis protein
MESGKERTSISVEHTLEISDGLLKRAKDVSKITESSQSIAQDTIEQERVIFSISEKVGQNAQAIQMLAELMKNLTENSDSIYKVTREYEAKAASFKI